METVEGKPETADRHPSPTSAGLQCAVLDRRLVRHVLAALLPLLPEPGLVRWRILRGISEHAA